MKRKTTQKVISIVLSIVMIICAVPMSVISAFASSNSIIYGAEETTKVAGTEANARETNIDSDWKFTMTTSDCYSKTYDDSSWTDISLPYDFSITQSFTTSGEAESGFLPGGTGWYRKKLVLPATDAGKHFELNFDGAYMHTYVYVNGVKVGENHYGYNSFAFDVTDNLVCDGTTENVIAVKVVNTIPSSRWYSGSGIYRDVTLITTDSVHVAHNGTKVSTPDISSGTGTVKNVVTVANDGSSSASATVTTKVYKKGTTTVLATGTSDAQTIAAGADAKFTVTSTVSNPELWDTENPNLYTIQTEVLVDGNTVDTYSDNFGFRYYSFSRTTAFQLNGEQVKLNGVCMHHDQGALGSAAYEDAMVRQLTKLKDMGVNAIRATHNPYSERFYELCDEMGFLVIEELFDGWKGAKNGNSNDFSSYFNATMDSANSIGSSSTETWSQFVLEETVARDYNRPSIIMWSLGNEIFEGYSNSADFTTEAANLRNWITAADSTRNFTIGDNNIKNSTSCYVNVDNTLGTSSLFVLGINYTSDSQNSTIYSNYTSWPMYESETSSATNTRGIYTLQTNNTGDSNRHLTAYDTSTVGWGKTAHLSLYDTLKNDNLAGEFVWTGFDYIGEPTPYNGTGTGTVSGGSGATPNSSYFGTVDTAGLEKDTFYLYRSQWKAPTSTDYTVHLVTSWDSDNYMLSSSKVPVWLYSNAPKVELYLNGTKIGTATRKTVTTSLGTTYYTYTTESNSSSVCTTSSGSASEALYSVFNVAYTAGTLSTKSYDENGNQIDESYIHGQYTVSTPGTASKLNIKRSITTDAVEADGSSLAYYEVDITDADGNIDTAATNDITFTVSGNATIAGVDNGDEATTDKFQQSSVWGNTAHTKASINALAGKAVVIVKSTEDAGDVTVTASATNLSSASVSLTTVEPEKESTGTVEDGEISSYTMIRSYTVKVGTNPTLKTDAKVTIQGEDGSQDATIEWEEISSDTYKTAGTYTVTGTLTYGTQSIPVTAQLYVVDNIVAMRNISTVTATGTAPTLPDTVAGLKSDATIGGYFNVTWEDVSASSYASTGTFTVNGSVDYFGTKMAVTASVRVADGTVSSEQNVAPDAAELDATSKSDTLTSLNDGVTTTDTSTSGRWSNWTNRSSDTSPTITFRWDTATSISKVTLYYYIDSSGHVPSSVAFKYSLNGTDYETVSATAGSVSSVINSYFYSQTFTLSETVNPISFQVIPTAYASGTCVALSEIELYKYSYDAPATKTSAILTELEVDGVGVDGFSSSKTDYEVSYFDTVTAKSTENAAVTVLPYDADVDSKAYVVVLSEDGNTSKTFTISTKEVVPPETVTKKTATVIEGDKVGTTNSETETAGVVNTFTSNSEVALSNAEYTLSGTSQGGFSLNGGNPNKGTATNSYVIVSGKSYSGIPNRNDSYPYLYLTKSKGSNENTFNISDNNASSAGAVLTFDTSTNFFGRVKGEYNTSITTDDSKDFYLMYADANSDNSLIPGYTAITSESEITSHTSYIIAHPDNFENPTQWYIMYPSTGGNAGDYGRGSYVGKVVIKSSEEVVTKEVTTDATIFDATTYTSDVSFSTGNNGISQAIDDYYLKGVYWNSNSDNTYINTTDTTAGKYLKVCNGVVNIGDFSSKKITGKKWSITTKYALKSDATNHTNASDVTVVGIGTNTKRSKAYNGGTQSVSSADLLNVTKDGNVYLGSSSTSVGTISDVVTGAYDSKKEITLSYDNGVATVSSDGTVIATVEVSDTSLYEMGPAYYFAGDSAENYVGGTFSYDDSRTNTGDCIHNYYLFSINATVTTTTSSGTSDDKSKDIATVKAEIENKISSWNGYSASSTGYYYTNSTAAKGVLYSAQTLDRKYGESADGPDITCKYGISTRTCGWSKVVMPSSTVLLYDGETTPSFPVSQDVRKKLSGYDSLSPVSTWPSSSSLKFSQKWWGYKDASTDTNWMASGSNTGYDYQESTATSYPVTGAYGNGRYWFNLCEYAGTGDTTNYYEDLSSPSFTFRYYYTNGSSGYANTTLATQGSLYVLNYQPIKSKVSEIKELYNKVKANDSIYDSTELLAFYNAVNNVISLDPTSYTYSSDTSTVVANVASAIKSVVQNDIPVATTEPTKKTVTVYFVKVSGKAVDKTYTYGDTITPIANTATKYEYLGNSKHSVTTYSWVDVPETATGTVTIKEKQNDTTQEDCTVTAGVCELCKHSMTDYSAYSAAMSVYDATTALEQYTVMYDETSRNAYTLARDDAYNYVGADYAEDVNVTQDELDSKVTALTEAYDGLTLQKYTAVFKYKVNDNDEVQVSKTSYDYGTQVTFNVPSDVSGEVYKWILESGADVKIESNSRSYTLIQKGNINFTAFLSDEDGSQKTNDYKVTIYGVSHKITDIKYIEEGTYDVEINEKTISLGGNSFEAVKPTFYNVTGFKVNGEEVKTGDTVTIDKETVIEPIYSPINSIDIKPASGSDIMINGVNETVPVLWDKKVTLTGTDTSDKTAWLINNKVVGYGKTYSFRATQACEVSYQNDQTPSATSSVSMFSYDAYRSSTVTAVAGYNLPEGATFVEAGVLLKTDRTTALSGSYDGQSDYTGATTLSTDWWTSAYSDGTFKGKFTTTKTSDTNQFLVNITRSATTSFIVGCVSYVTYTDSTGTHTVFSDQRLIAFQK